MIASEFGTSRAPPMPCTVLAKMSCSGLAASPDHTEARAKSTSPAENTRRRPRRSPRLPPTRTSEAKRSV